MSLKKKADHIAISDLFHPKLQVFYMILIYEKCWCQVVSTVFVLHIIYVVQIGQQHC